MCWSPMGLVPVDLLKNKMIKYFCIYKSNQYPFLHTLIGSCISQYPRLLVDFEAEVKMTGSTHAKNSKKVYIVLFL